MSKVASKLSSSQRKIFNADTKTFIKAEMIDKECLNPTALGRGRLRAFLWDKYKTEMLKEAKDIIAENESEG